ncbi:tumor necrosis factor ligand superfamily member 12 [Gadus chalcogrammus]|uniref:tumor necrosis factor ligand superfamily member 12 n=1 Tax=Gadus chalcogrammus TaxID=1042646 RepID=UPI0024C4AF34|nr:tumor necrosis factor ligand superfamily member 12 [Gadus chalcogrammus]
MHRILQRRRMRKLRVVWVSLALMALSLAACSALFTAWTWRQTRDLSQSFKILQDRLEQVNTQRKAIVQLILEKRELLVGHRVKRDGTGRDR